MATHLSSPVGINVEWKHSASNSPGLDLSAFMLNADGKIRSLEDVVYYGTSHHDRCNLMSADESVLLSASKDVKQNLGEQLAVQKMTIKLDRVDAEIKRIVFVVSTDSDTGIDSYRGAAFAMSHGKTKESPIDLTGNDDESVKCMIVGGIERFNASWRFFVEETAISGTLEEAYNEYSTADLRKKYPYDRHFSKDWIKNELEANRIKALVEEAENRYDFASIISYCDELIKKGHAEEMVIQKRNDAVQKIGLFNRYLQEAEDFLSKEIWDCAKKSSESVLEISPNNRRAQEIRTSATGELEKLCKVSGFLQQAQSELRNGNYKKAKLSVDEVLVLDSKNPLALNLLGKIKQTESNLKQTLNSLLDQLDEAKRKKDYRHALEICNLIISKDKAHQTKWQKELESLSRIVGLMSERMVRKAIAEIKAGIRLGEAEQARMNLLQLQSDLHSLDNHDKDGIIEDLFSQCSPTEKDKIEEAEEESVVETPEPNPIDAEALDFLKKKDFRRAKAIFASRQQSDMARLCTELIVKSKVIDESCEILQKLNSANRNRYSADLRILLPKLSEIKSLYLQYGISVTDVDMIMTKINNNL